MTLERLRRGFGRLLWALAAVNRRREVRTAHYACERNGHDPDRSEREYMRRRLQHIEEELQVFRREHT